MSQPINSLATWVSLKILQVRVGWVTMPLAISFSGLAWLWPPESFSTSLPYISLTSAALLTGLSRQSISIAMLLSWPMLYFYIVLRDNLNPAGQLPLGVLKV